MGSLSGDGLCLRLNLRVVTGLLLQDATCCADGCEKSSTSIDMGSAREECEAIRGFFFFCVVTMTFSHDIRRTVPWSVSVFC